MIFDTYTNSHDNVVLLWTNDNETENFSGNTILVPESLNYNLILVDVRSASNDTTPTYNTNMVVNHGGIDGAQAVRVSDGQYIYNRSVTFEESGIKFSNGQRGSYGSTGWTAGSSYAIPVRIYGCFPK